MKVRGDFLLRTKYTAGVAVYCMGHEVGFTLLTDGALTFYLCFLMLYSLLCLAESRVSTCLEVVCHCEWVMVLADAIHRWQRYMVNMWSLGILAGIGLGSFSVLADYWA
ncbi:hypothetical protein Tco_0269133 [Tanacetum coccineum]